MSECLAITAREVREVLETDLAGHIADARVACAQESPRSFQPGGQHQILGRTAEPCLQTPLQGPYRDVKKLGQRGWGQILGQMRTYMVQHRLRKDALARIRGSG